MEGTRLREKADEENWTAVPRLGCRCGFLRGFLRHIESVVTFCQNKGLFGRKLKTDRTEHDVRESSNCRRSRKARKIQRPSLRASAARVCAIASAADEVRRKRSTRPPPWPTNTRCASRHVCVRRVHAPAARDRGPRSRASAPARLPSTAFQLARSRVRSDDVPSRPRRTYPTLTSR